MIIAALPELFPGFGMLVYIAVVLAIFAVLVFPIAFPLAVSATYMIKKKRPGRSAIAIFVVVQIISSAAMIALGKFLLWASQQ
jgi:hypothetical protein